MSYKSYSLVTAGRHFFWAGHPFYARSARSGSVSPFGDNGPQGPISPISNGTTVYCCYCQLTSEAIRAKQEVPATDLHFFLYQIRIYSTFNTPTSPSSFRLPVSAFTLLAEESVVRTECACRREILLNDYSRGLNIRHDTYKTGQLFILL